MRSVDSCCTSIELARNNVGADGAAALGALLRDNTLLKTLDISALPAATRPLRRWLMPWRRFHFGVDAMAPLQMHRSDTGRATGWNGVGARGAAALAAALKENTCAPPQMPQRSTRAPAARRVRVVAVFVGGAHAVAAGSAATFTLCWNEPTAPRCNTPTM